MKQIVIRQLTLINFKGIRNLTVNFDEHETSIFGANGSGKTTIFDAFTWVLFGKDSHDRKDFNIKTLQADNRPIERIPHEVSVCIDVNGLEINLKKCYSENWTKKRGSSVETFNGHSVECYYNDVPCSVTEYAKKIAELCDENIFKLITNPLFFTAQKKDFQRNTLFSLAGAITYSDIANERPEFAELVNTLSGKTLEEYKREIQSKKRKIKDGVDTIPARIDERKRDMPEERDWSVIEREIEEAKKRIADIDNQIADRSQSYMEISKRKQEIARSLSETRTQITNREYALRDSILDDYNKAIKDHNAAVSNAERLRNERKYKAITLPRLEKELADLQENRNVLVQEWRDIKAMRFSFDEETMVCPTCKRKLETEDIEAERYRLETEFNNNVSRKLESNKQRGLETKTAIEGKQYEIERVKNELFQLDNEIAQIENSKPYSNQPVQPDTTPTINSDRTIIDLRNKVTDLQNQLDEELSAPDTSDLKQKRMLEDQSIKANEAWLSDRAVIAGTKKRIAELEKEYQESQNVLAELEGIEYNIQQFSKARIEQVENRINGMFSIVKFKMFEQQINGGEIETCEAMVDGVPFSDLNKAMKMNAGLDIINAICRANGIVAPIFIDNRESVSEIIPVSAQVINLVVDANCKTLKIE